MEEESFKISKNYHISEHKKNTPYAFKDCLITYFELQDIQVYNLELCINRIENIYKNTTVSPLTHMEAIYRICSSLVNHYEIIQKFGGVYSKQYYKYRIIENLLLDKPIIAKLATGKNDDWALVVGYDNSKDCIHLKLPKQVQEINYWYESIEDLLLLGDVKMSKG